MRRAHKLLTLGILGAAVSPVLAGPQFSGRNADGTWNVYEVITTPATWDQARVDAKALNFNGTQGHLVSIISAAENNFVRTILPGDSWIGLSDSDQTSSLDNTTLTGTEAGTNPNGGWKWVSGEAFSYQNFAGGEPNDVGGEDAAQLRGDGLWNDHQAGPSLGQGGQTFRYVVEYRTNSATNPILPTLRPAPAPVAGQFQIHEVTNNGGVGNLADVDASLTTDRTATPLRVDHQKPVINFHDSDGTGNFQNDNRFAVTAAPGGPAVGSVNDLAMLATGRVRIPTSGNYTFGVNSDDGFKLSIGGKSFTGTAGQGETTIVSGSLAFGLGRGAQNSLGHIFLEAGDYDLQLEYWEGGGGSSVELFAAAGTHTGFNNQFRLVGSPAIPAGPIVPRKAGNIKAPGFDVVVLRDDPAVEGDAGATNIDPAISQVTAHWNGSTPAGLTVSTATASVINYVDPQGGGGNKPGYTQTPFPGDLDTAEDRFSLGAKATLEIVDGGEYTFMVLGDDGSQLRLLNTSGWTSGGGSQPHTVLADGVKFSGCCGDAFAYVNLAPGTEYPLEFIWNEIGGGAYVGLWGAYGRHTSFNDAFQLLGENSSTMVPITPFISEGLQLVAVPEPASLSLLAIGALALVGRRRRTA